jgi:hypothetical protein
MPTWGDAHITDYTELSNTFNPLANVYFVGGQKTISSAYLGSTKMSQSGGYSVITTELKNNKKSIAIDFYGLVIKYNGCKYRIYHMGSNLDFPCYSDDNSNGGSREYSYRLWLDSSEFAKSKMQHNNTYTGEMNFKLHINNKLIIPIKIPIRVNVPTTP